MPTYRLQHRGNHGVKYVMAYSAQGACAKAGWMISDCHVQKLEPVTMPNLSEDEYRLISQAVRESTTYMAWQEELDQALRTVSAMMSRIQGMEADG